jgi:hypothetical protein
MSIISSQTIPFSKCATMFAAACSAALMHKPGPFIRCDLKENLGHPPAKQLPNNRNQAKITKP